MPRKGLWAAALALGLAWLTVPGVPLYDGVGFPDEPYRYVQPPAGYRHTAAPTSATGHVAASKGVSDDFFDAPSEEQGPQVEVYASAGSLRGGPAVRGFDTRVDPGAPGPAAQGMRFEGNAYHLTLTATPSGPITLTPPTDQIWIWIALRSTTSSPHGPVIVYRPTPSSPWVAKPTDQTGIDVFATHVLGSGDYALVYLPKPAGSARRGSGGGATSLVVVLGVSLGLVAVVIVAVRIARTRAR